MSTIEAETELGWDECPDWRLVVFPLKKRFLVVESTGDNWILSSLPPDTAGLALYLTEYLKNVWHFVQGDNQDVLALLPELTQQGYLADR